MRNVLKTYELELTLAGPVFIGSGKEIGKKEYAFFPQVKHVAVLDVGKLSRLLSQRNMLGIYGKFLMGSSREDVGRWLEAHKISQNQYMQCARYHLSCQDAVLDSHSKLSILEFVKDAYGMPYVPGSSVKGMLRTILLANRIGNMPQDYREVKENVADTLQSYRLPKPRRTICKRESAMMEGTCFRTLERPRSKPLDAVNDTLAGLIVGDSKPLSTEDLVLCQRTELHTDGKEKKLNVLREALRPGTVVHIPLTIDNSICDVTKEELEQAIASFGEMYYKCFLRKYPGMDLPRKESVWLGGGAGFVTKTEVYPLFGERQGIDVAVDIFRVTGVPQNHKHREDRKKGVSPHVCKVAYYKGKRYQMGLCLARVLEVE